MKSTYSALALWIKARSPRLHTIDQSKHQYDPLEAGTTERIFLRRSTYTKASFTETTNTLPASLSRLELMYDGT